MNHPPRNIVIDWLNTIWNTNLDPQSKLIACNLRRYMNAQNDMAWPSNARIVGETGLSESTVRRRLHLLCSEGWLVDTGHSNHGTVMYQASFPAMDAGGVRVTGVSARPDRGVSVTPELNNELNNTLSKGFKRPTLEEVKAYCAQKGYTIDPETFINYYDSNGWKVGRSSMKNWKAAVANWNKREKTNGSRSNGKGNSSAVETIRAEDLLNQGYVNT